MNSIYIPRLICQSPSEEMVKDIMYAHGFGTPTDVDIVKKINFNNGRPYYSAFVYFDECIDSTSPSSLYSMIEQTGMYRLNLKNCYWLLLKNKNPQPQCIRVLNKTLEQLTDQDYSNILEWHAMHDRNVAHYGDMWRCSVVEDSVEDDLIERHSSAASLTVM